VEGVSDDIRDDFDESFADGLFEAPRDRKDFLYDSAKLLAAAAAAGPFFMAAKQAAAAELASLGQDPIATGAVNAAKANFSDVTISRIAESGPQALEPKNFSGPLWNKLVGGKISVVEAPFAQIRTKALAEHLAKSGALDVIDTSPAWVPEFADRGVIIPIDDLVTKYKAKATFSDLHPLYRLLSKYKGQTWGFFDDGDVWNLYYRKDIFGDAKLKKAYKAKFKRDLRVPTTWDEFDETA